jgi:hypothetical protein
MLGRLYVENDEVLKNRDPLVHDQLICLTEALTFTLTLPAVKLPTEVSSVHLTAPSQSRCILSRGSQGEEARGGISERLPSASTILRDGQLGPVPIATFRSKNTLMISSECDLGTRKFWREFSGPLSCKWKEI